MAINVTGPTTPGKEMEDAVELELAAFNEWFARSVEEGGAGNTPLIPSELALVRTYLFARLSGRVSPPSSS